MNKPCVILTMFMLVVCMLVPAAVFAQITFSGGIEGYTMLGKADLSSVKSYRDVKTSAGWDLNIAANVFNASDTAGGKVEFDAAGTTVNAWAYIWWKPIDQLYLKLGNIFEDTTWAGSDYTTAWGLHGNKLDNVRPYFLSPDYDKPGGYAGSVLDQGHGFFYQTQAFSGVALQLTVKPIDNLTFNLGFPMGRNLTMASNYVDNIHAQVVYSIPLAGEAAVGFVNRPSDDNRENAFKDLYLQWKMFLGQDMNLETGVDIRMAGLTLSNNRHYDGPVNIGIGWNKGDAEYDDQLVLTARMGIELPLAYLDPTVVALDFVANQALNTGSRLHIAVGFGVQIPNTGNTLFAWNVNPYYTQDLGGPNFYVGIQLFNGGSQWDNYADKFKSVISDSNKDRVNWAVPLGIRWDF